MSYTTVKGHIFNITNVFTFINSKSTSNTTNDGANSTVSYLGVNFKNLSYINNGFENTDFNPYVLIICSAVVTNGYGIFHKELGVAVTVPSESFS